MSKRILTRRDFVRLTAAGTAGMLAACVAPAPQAPGAPAAATAVSGAAETAAEEAVSTMGFPRSETLLADMATGRVAAPANFNEWVGWKSRDRGMAQLMNEPMWTDEYAAGEIIDGLAAGTPSYTEDFTEVTIPLRQGVYWSDGTEFTADDVIFTIEKIKATEGLNYNVQLQEVASVTAPDKYTVVVTLTKPNSRFHTYFLDRWGCLWIMPKHVFEKVEDIQTFEYNPPLSLGPYVLHSYDEAGFWTAWERREDWARTPTGMLYGEPKPRYVVFKNYTDVATKVMDQSRHELDTTASWMTIESLKAVMMVNKYSIGYQSGFPWVENLHPCATGITFNCLKAPFDNKEVRWALTLAIDIVSFIATAYDGAATMGATHIPMVPLYMKWYFEPTQEWLSNFTIDLGDGETLQAYDPDAPNRQAEYAKARGYQWAENADFKSIFGYGWWKYAPDAAAKLLEKNGFTRNADEKWLLPDGTPWKFTILTGTQAGGASYQNAFAAAHEWQKFGIEVDVMTTEQTNSLYQNGEYEVGTQWPVYEAWGAHLDMFRSYDFWNSAYLEPELGKPMYGHTSRWTDPRMDQVIADLKNTDWNDDERMAELGIAGMKIAVEEMPGIPTFAYSSAIANDTYYWKNWPSADNLYTQPHHHWPNFKYMLPFLQPTGGNPDAA